MYFNIKQESISYIYIVYTSKEFEEIPTKKRS